MSGDGVCGCVGVWYVLCGLRGVYVVWRTICVVIMTYVVLFDALVRYA